MLRWVDGYLRAMSPLIIDVFKAKITSAYPIARKPSDIILLLGIAEILHR